MLTRDRETVNVWHFDRTDTLNVKKGQKSHVCLQCSNKICFENFDYRNIDK